MEINTVLTWLVLLVLVGIVSYLLYKSVKPSPISIFDIKEMSWIPTEVLETVRKGVNDVLLPKLTNVTKEIWDKFDRSTKDKILKQITDDFKKTADTINSNSIALPFFNQPSAELESPSPSPLQTTSPIP